MLVAMRRTARLLWSGRLAVLLASALAFPDCTCGQPGAPCTPGAVQACPCANGAMSFQSCDAGGWSFGACACDETMDEKIALGLTPTASVFALANMAPGDQSTGVLTVQNSLSFPVRYAVVSVTSEDKLAQQLLFTVSLGADGGCGSPGATLYGPGILGSSAGTSIVGDAAQGAQPGDRDLAPGAIDTLCVSVSLPLTAGNELQGLGTAAALHFNAEQIEANP